MEAPVIAIVVPCYNEQQALPLCIGQLKQTLNDLIVSGHISPRSFILCCDDGSTDDTWETIKTYHASDSSIKGLSLTANRGHQNVLYAGLMYVAGRCDAAISIDADLQDDPRAIGTMVEKFKAGADIVYGVRKDRKSDSWFKRFSAKRYYALRRHLGLDSIPDHADCRLMSRRAIEYLCEYGEHNLFLRGIVAQLGLSADTVVYDRRPRLAGKSKYTIGRMLGLSIDGITSFSSRPLRLILLTGVMLLLLDIAMSIYVFISYFGHDVIPGWTSIMLSVWFLGSIMLIGLGVLGEYIGKIYVEVKQRPRYQIKETLND